MAGSDAPKRRNRQAPDEDAALVTLAQEGDEQAFTLLVARCEPLLRAQVARLCPPNAGLDQQDMAQEGLLGLLDAVKTFRPEGGASFRTYAAVCVRNRLISVLRHHAAHVKEPVLQEDAAWHSRTANPEALIMEQESAEEILRRLRDGLTPREFAVTQRYLDGCSYIEIAAAMQTTVKAVDSTLQRVRRKLRRAADNSQSQHPEW